MWICLLQSRTPTYEGRKTNLLYTKTFTDTQSHIKTDTYSCINSIISKISYFWVFLLLLDFQHACLEYYFYCLLYSKLSIRFLNDIHYSCDIHITANNKLVRINLRFEFEPQKLNHGDVLSFDTRQNATNSVARGRNNTLLY